MTKRKSISKKVRFDVFKRDDFTCAYCGSHPPAVILEVDHIIAVAEGGGGGQDNLITSCRDCNRGKGARSLRSIPQSLSERQKDITEKEEQLECYKAVVAAKRRRVEQDIDDVDDILQDYNPGYCMSDSARRSVSGFLDYFTVDELIEFMHGAHSRRNVSDPFRYFCGMCWKRIRGESD